MAVRSLKNSTLENFSNYSSSMNAGYDFNDYELIQSAFLASDTSAVTFSNLNQYITDFKHLQVRYTARTNRGTFANDVLKVRFNSDTTNYTGHILFGGGTSGLENGVVSGQNFGAFAIGNTTTSIGVSGNFGAGVIDILDVYSSKNKTLRCLSGYHHSNTQVATYSAVRISLSSMLWMNSEAVSTVILEPLLGTTLVAGSRFSLYGIR